MNQGNPATVRRSLQNAIKGKNLKFRQPIVRDYSIRQFIDDAVDMLPFAQVQALAQQIRGGDGDLRQYQDLAQTLKQQKDPDQTGLPQQEVQVDRNGRPINRNRMPTKKNKGVASRQQPSKQVVAARKANQTIVTRENQGIRMQNSLPPEINRQPQMQIASQVQNASQVPNAPQVQNAPVQGPAAPWLNFRRNPTQGVMIQPLAPNQQGPSFIANTSKWLQQKYTKSGDLTSKGAPEKSTPYFINTYAKGQPQESKPTKAQYYQSLDANDKEAMQLMLPGAEFKDGKVIQNSSEFTKFFAPRTPKSLSITRAKDLAGSTVQIEQLPQAFLPALYAVNSALVGAGYQPMGPVSSKSSPLYLGRYYDPKTNRVRTVKNPKFYTYNPTSADQAYGYLTTAIAYKWNQVIRLIERLKKFDNPKQFQMSALQKQGRKQSQLYIRKQQMSDALNKIARGAYPPFEKASPQQRVSMMRALHEWNYSEFAQIVSQVATNYLTNNPNLNALMKSYWTKMMDLPRLAAQKVAVAQYRGSLQQPVLRNEARTIARSIDLAPLLNQNVGNPPLPGKTVKVALKPYTGSEDRPSFRLSPLNGTSITGF